MKKFIIIAVTVIIVTVIGVLVLGDKQSSTSNTIKSEQVYATIQADMNKGALLVDVRTPEEFAAGHIEQAVNVPLDKILAGTNLSDDKSTTQYVYCRSGNRSAQAKAALQAAGYTNVVDLGGMNEVVAMGARQAR